MYFIRLLTYKHGAKFSVLHEASFAVAQGHPRGPRIGSLKSSCRISYWSSIKTIALNCLDFEKTAFLYAFLATDKQTDMHHRLYLPHLRAELNNCASVHG